jgi:hypothetical protein
VHTRQALLGRGRRTPGVALAPCQSCAECQGATQLRIILFCRAVPQFVPWPWLGCRCLGVGGVGCFGCFGCVVMRPGGGNSGGAVL